MTRIALITGGNRGLGRSEALALAADGTDVVITYRSHADEAKAVVAEIEALGRTAVALQLDTAVPETFDAFADTLRATLTQTWAATGSTCSSTTRASPRRPRSAASTSPRCARCSTPTSPAS
jgi:NAD(P)-dependent dehydrogenase (short-subunit alcohol dehydrogenase family)